MENRRIPKPGEIYHHFKDKPYQIITVATNTETLEPMVVYQALYGDFKMYVRPLDMFLSEVDHEKYPDITQHDRFELRSTQSSSIIQNQTGEEDTVQTKQQEETQSGQIPDDNSIEKDVSAKTDIDIQQAGNNSNETVNDILLQFLDAASYTKKMEILTSNTKHLNDRIINDMAVSLDCTVDEGPLDQRIQGLIYCLKQLCRFEDRRLR